MNPDKAGKSRRSRNSNTVSSNNKNGGKNKNRSSSAAPVLTPSLRVGYSGSLLLQLSTELSSKNSLLENNCIVGDMPTEEVNIKVYKKLEVVSKFIQQHALLKQHALSSQGKNERKRKRENSNSTNDHSSSHIIAAPYYMPTIKKFASTQVDRQAAGLRTNTRKEREEGLADLIHGHSAAMKFAIEHSARNSNGPTINGSFGLNKNVLCSMHSILCPSQSGKFRINQAKAGKTMFCSAVKIDAEIRSLFILMESLWLSWLQKRGGSNIFKETYQAVSLATILMYCLNDIHPFVDGNGRLARICANYALHRTLGLPFTLTLVATEAHRQEYIDGLRKGHLTVQRLKEQKISFSSSGKNDRSLTTFEPLIHMILDRMAHAIQQLQQSLNEKAHAVTEDEENRIARLVRERAASGQCIICLDDQPNIATLCCGQAVHLNCIAEWLANQTTCVKCRHPLPKLKRPAAPNLPPASSGQPDTTTFTDVTVEDNDTVDTTTNMSSYMFDTDKTTTNVPQ